jgi:hypothetical protein
LTKPLNPDEFKKLQAKWDKKLADDGFFDIEQRDGNLKVWASHLHKVHYNETLYRAKEDYYRLAGQFLHDHKFDSRLERAVWELHSTGVGMREIVVMLKKRRMKIYKWKVQQIVKKLSEEMGRQCR